VSRPLILIVGDSIAEGLGNANDSTYSFIDMALEPAKLLHVKVAKGSERGATWIQRANQSRRMMFGLGCNYAIWEHTVNDWRSPQISFSALASIALIGWQQLQASGLDPYATTGGPASSSSDGWATTAGQTKNLDDYNRILYNTWLRTGAPCARSTLVSAQSLSGTTLTLADASAFPNRSVVVCDGVAVSYTGKSGNALQGCAVYSQYFPQPPAGVNAPAGSVVLGPVGSIYCVLGSGQTLPLATVTVDSTAGFASSGTLIVRYGPMTYTGTTATTFTGCSIPGAGGGVGTFLAQQQISVPGAAIVVGHPDHPLAGFFEIGDLMETSRGSGIWKAPGYTADGVHPSQTAHQAMSTGIDTTVFV